MQTQVNMQEYKERVEMNTQENKQVYTENTI